MPKELHLPSKMHSFSSTGVQQPIVEVIPKWSWDFENDENIEGHLDVEFILDPSIPNPMDLFNWNITMEQQRQQEGSRSSLQHNNQEEVDHHITIS